MTPSRTGRHVALLRGINVGGANLIKMSALKTCFEDQGFGAVTTYIASGNVLFTAPGGDRAKLVLGIEEVLSKTFGYTSTVVLRSATEMQRTVAGAPDGFGSQPASYRYDVLFLKEPLTAAEALKTVPLQEGVDDVAAGPGALYFSRLASKASQSKLSRVAAMPIYKRITVRNWNTTTKLAALLAAGAD
jgi:uncharacterized protein (DUF1697 family)